MQAVLVMFRNDGEKRSFSISREMTVIGRRQDCDLMIPLGEISRKHCRVIRDGDSLRIEDLGSSNGTFHNGRRIQEAVLKSGDTVQVGPVVFVVQVDGQPADDDIRPFAAGAVGGAMAAHAGQDDALESLPEDSVAPMPMGDDEDELELLSDDTNAEQFDLLDDDDVKPSKPKH